MISDKKVRTVSLREALTTSADLFEVLPESLSLWDGRVRIEKSEGRKARNWKKHPRKDLADWPPNPGSYEIRDPASPVAFVCPSQNQELQAKAIDWGVGISGPCVTPDRGVELIVANTVANPNLRFFVLGGKDSGHLAGDVLYCLWRYGIDPESHRVLKTRCPTNPYLRNLPPEIIKRFREQVAVINLLKCPDETLIHLAIRACMQEPKHPLLWQDKKLERHLVLFDPGSEGKEPLVHKLGLGVEQETFFEGVHRVGATIHAPTVAQAWPLLRSHILAMGKMGINESTREVKDTVGVQIIIHQPGRNLVPGDWKPHGWMETKEQVKKWLGAYATWVYLFPSSDVRFNQEEDRVEPYIPEKMDYSYGTRLTAWGVDLASKKEQLAVRRLVIETHRKFIRLGRLPNFEEVVGFYRRLEKLQKGSVNSWWRLSKAVKICVNNEVTAAYRNYVVLQDPRVDLRTDLRLAHNPCFCLYEAYPRRINQRWQIDVGFFLRAHDFMAFPANAAGGMKLQEFLAWYAGIKPGVYLHHTGCLHIQDYLLPK